MPGEKVNMPPSGEAEGTTGWDKLAGSDIPKQNETVEHTQLDSIEIAEDAEQEDSTDDIKQTHDKTIESFVGVQDTLAKRFEDMLHAGKLSSNESFIAKIEASLRSGELDNDKAFTTIATNMFKSGALRGVSPLLDDMSDLYDKQNEIIKLQKRVSEGIAKATVATSNFDADKSKISNVKRPVIDTYTERKATYYYDNQGRVSSNPQDILDVDRH